MTQTFPEIWLDETVGISIDDIQAGLDAAMEVFQQHNVSPKNAIMIPEAWAEAEQAALQTAYKGWTTIPGEVKLILVEPKREAHD